MYQCPSLLQVPRPNSSARAIFRVFEGTIEAHEQNLLVVRGPFQVMLQEGEKFLFQTKGKITHMFMATYIGMNEECLNEVLLDRLRGFIGRDRLRFRIGTAVQRIYKDRQNRFPVKGIWALVTVNGQYVEATVLDVSENGLKLLSPKALPVGSIVGMQIQTPNDTVLSCGFVRYCERDPQARSKYQVGVFIEQLSERDREQLLAAAVKACA
jgi:hypothetical protein